MGELRMRTLRLDDIDTETVKTRSEDPDRTQVAVEDYRYAYENGAEMPRIQVYECPDHGMVLVDGWHRTAAAKLAGFETIEAVVVGSGSVDDAHRYALENTNLTHGLRLTGADKHERISQAIEHELYPEQSDREIARRLGVSHSYVSRLRRGLCASTQSDGEVCTSTHSSPDEGEEGHPPGDPYDPVPPGGSSGGVFSPQGEVDIGGVINGWARRLTALRRQVERRASNLGISPQDKTAIVGTLSEAEEAVRQAARSLD